MSGQYSAIGTLTETDLDVFTSNGFTLNILLDVSHNENIETVSKDRPKNPVIAKRIELDCQMDKGDSPNYAQFIADCSAKTPASPLRNFIDKIKAEAAAAGKTDAAHLQATLERSKIKIEFPQFDTSIAALDSLYEGIPVGNAIAAARAPDAAAFNALSEFVRRSMGMYQRNTATSFSRMPGGDQSVRTSYPAPGDDDDD